jgi:3,4-dihydroxy-9,10-secoandrosta-1,3,5(10)-triene-9,17-dione 4,5-dioxygenase
MIDVRALGYVVVEATRVDAWRRYAQDRLGMQALDAPDGALYLKMDEPIGDGGTPPALHHVFEPR